MSLSRAIDAEERFLRRACADMSPAEADRVFFGHGKAYSAAQRLCGGCVIRTECLELGLRLDRSAEFDVFGVWGGLNREQRASLTNPS